MKEKPVYIHMGDIRSKHLGKFISFYGVIDQVFRVLPSVTSAVFQCNKCKKLYSVKQVTNTFRQPVGCSCKSEDDLWTIVKKKMRDEQKIIVSNMNLNKRATSKISVFLYGSLTNSDNNLSESTGKIAKIIGKLIDIPVRTDDGHISRKFDWGLEAKSFKIVGKYSDWRENDKR